MQITDFYTKAGGDYEEVKSRLLTDERICKFLNRFTQADDFTNLKSSLAAQNWEDAFRFSHNLKGMCLNLGLQNFFSVSSALCENLRGGAPKQDSAPLMEAVEIKYYETIALINEFLAV